MVPQLLRSFRRLALWLLVSLPVLGAEPRTTVQEWSFADGTLEGWRPARHLTAAKVRDGVLVGTISGHDPQLISPPLDVAATPYQEIHVRLKCDRDGKGELFYTNTFEGQYGGFRGDWVLGYEYRGGGNWQEIRIRPFWQGAERIRQIRFDPPPGSQCEIDWIRLVTRAVSDPCTVTSWEAVGDSLPGWTTGENGFLESPALAVPLASLPWLHLDLEAPTEGHVSLLWSTTKGAAGKTDFFLPRYGGHHVTGMDLGAGGNWQGTLVYLALRATAQDGKPVKIHAVRLAGEAPEKADVRVLYFGPENAVNRVGQPCRFLLRLLNEGAATAHVRLGKSGSATGADELRQGVVLDMDLPWTGSLSVVPTQPGELSLSLSLQIDGKTVSLTSEPMTVLGPAPALTTGTIPPPVRAPTKYRIGAYYYPGFGQPYQWGQLERTAPWAKPVLGYYDEGNPECVDWQIKYAVEHGISFFLVDWYWVAGKTHHMHYLDALRRARFRDQLQWAVMWANHNPPGTHSEADWRNVVQFWIDNYFRDPQYLQVDGRPAVFIWAPNNIRADLGGSDQAARLAEIAQEMTRAAGLPGINLISMRRGGDEDLHREGYSAVTSYHWWNDSVSRAADSRYLPYSLVVERSPDGWDSTEARLKAANLGFIPVVDTGWDARPRHGSNTMVIYDRSPALFRRSLADAKSWLDERGQDLLILGPLNEWTEGSYIEPCTEYGFAMYEAVRSVFCTGPAPAIVGPTDVGLGPYDFDLSTPGAKQTDWSFAEAGNAQGWRAMMGMKDMQVADGSLTAVTTTHDPAFLSDRLELRAPDFTAIEVTMAIDPAPAPKEILAVFWGTEAASINGRANVSVALATDTAEHTYRLDLAAHGLWRGLLRELRVDPCQVANRTVRITRIRLVPSKE